MPRPEPGPRMLTSADLEELTARAGLPPARRVTIRAAAAVTGFGITSYVADELIDWPAAPDDPLWRLVFPAEDMLDKAVTGQIAGLLRAGAPASQAGAVARQARGRPPAAGPHRAGERVLPGACRISHDTVLVYPPGGPGYGLTCPGSAWPARRPVRCWPPLMFPGSAAPRSAWWSSQGRR